MRRNHLIITAALAGLLAACASDTAGGGDGDDKQDHRGPDAGTNNGDNGVIPTKGLEMLAKVGDQAQLEALFHASSADSDSTIGLIKSEMAARNTTILKIKGEGVPVFTDASVGGFDLRLGRALSSIARSIWSGKFFTFRLEASGELNTTLQNAIIGTEIINAQVNIMSMADAMIGRGEDAPGASMEKFGFNETPVEIDVKTSVILDYELERLSLFSSIIDEIRPVTAASLADAGIELLEGASLDDLWIGRATALFGFFDQRREFVVYFALQFDRDSIEVPASE